MKITETIRSVWHSHEPYISECFVHWPSNCSFLGIEAELNWQMLTVVGFDVQFIKANSSEEMFHLISNGSADITCLSKGLTIENFRLGDPTVPVSVDYPIFILPDKGGSSMDSNLLLSTCHLSVWLTCLILAMCCFAGGHFIKKMGRPELSSVDNFICVSYYLALGVVLGVCGNFLAVALSAPTATKPIFRNLLEYSQLVASRQCRAILVEKNLEYGAMRHLTNPDEAYFSPKVRKNLIKAYAINPPILVNTLPMLIRLIKSYPGCLIGIDWHLGLPFIENQYCNIKVYDVYPMKSSFVFYTRRHWPHREALDALITKTSVDDIYKRIVKKHIVGMSKNVCKDINKGSHGLSIGQMNDTFYFLSLASGLAVIVFSLEKISDSLQRWKQNWVTPMWNREGKSIIFEKDKTSDSCH